MRNLLLAFIAAGILLSCVLLFQNLQAMREKEAAERLARIAALKETQDFYKRLLDLAREDPVVAERLIRHRMEKEGQKEIQTK